MLGAPRRIRRPWRALAGLGLVVVFGFLAGQQGGRSWLDALDRLIYDAGVRVPPVVRDERILIVDIDERSLAEHGRWPWPRSLVAELVQRISGPGRAAVVAFDVVFAERERSDDGDARLANALRDRSVVLGFYFTSDRGGRTSGTLPAPAMSVRALPDGVSYTGWNGYGAPLDSLSTAVRGAGFVNPVLDADGVVRMLPLLAEFGGNLYESLDLAILRQYLGNGVLRIDRDRVGIEGEKGRAAIPLSRGLSAMVPYSGRWPGTNGAFPYVSASAVLGDDFDFGAFAGRIVLIGTSAPGLTDLRATPIGEAVPGVEVHALMLRGALDGTIRSRPDEGPLLGLLAMAAAGVPLALLAPSFGPVGVLLAVATALLALVAWYAYALTVVGWVVPLSGGLLLVLCVGGLNLAAGYFVEGRSRRAVTALFGEYVSPALVDRMAADPLNYRVDVSETRVLTILFADIRGFTRMSERMAPQQLREYLNEFLTRMTEVIHLHGGTVDKYIGDAIMAFWGAPVEDPRHADHAVAAAVEMQRRVAELSDAFVARGLPPLAVGIGLNTGEARVGDMGSQLRRAYTAIGDSVNLASRLEGLTKQYDVPVVVGEATVSACTEGRFCALDTVNVSGRDEAVRIFVPASLAGVSVRNPTSRHGSNETVRARV